ncbi:MAG: 50S ribosomal protein L11 methyltransferase [Mycobacteriales bacterium]
MTQTPVAQKPVAQTPAVNSETASAASTIGLAAAGVRAALTHIDEVTATTRRALDAVIDGHIPAGVLAELSATVVPRWHFAMLNDHERNDAFATALERQLTPGAHVLDIGSGSGLLALAAARAGAGHVTTCEANPLLAEVARQVIAAHGYADRVTVLAGHSGTMRVGRELAAPADLIISEIVDCGLVGEGILPTIMHARAELLAPGGVMLPVGARLIGQLVQAPVITDLNHVDVACGFDVTLMNSLATFGHFPVRLATRPHSVLCHPAELLSFDFTGPVGLRHQRTVPVTVTASGIAHAMVAWFELDLGAGVVVRTTPDNAVTHWMQAFIPFTTPIRVDAGERLRVDIRCDGTRLFAAPRSTDAPPPPEERTP